MAFQVFSGETGGFVNSAISTSIAATSGAAVFIGNHHQYQVAGTIVSGELLIPRSGICNFVPGEYMMLSRVYDSAGLIYFLTPEDLEVVYVPSF